MKYINKKTRAIIESPCAISGGDWSLYEELKDKSKEIVKDVVKNEDKKSDLTKDEIMNELDALGIEYDKKAKKEDLYKLMMGE